MSFNCFHINVSFSCKKQIHFSNVNLGKPLTMIVPSSLSKFSRSSNSICLRCKNHKKGILVRLLSLHLKNSLAYLEVSLDPHSDSQWKNRFGHQFFKTTNLWCFFFCKTLKPHLIARILAVHVVPSLKKKTLNSRFTCWKLFGKKRNEFEK